MTPEPDFTWREWIAVVVILVAGFISGLIACDMLQPRCAAAAEEKLPAYLTSMDDACVGDLDPKRAFRPMLQPDV